MGDNFQFWRTLCRVVGKDKDGFWVCLPGWNHSVAIFVDKKSFPTSWRIRTGFRFYCRANITVTHPWELKLKRFSKE